MPQLRKVITRSMQLLTRRGVLVDDEGSTYIADDEGDSDEARILRRLQAAVCTDRIVFGQRAGQKVLTVQAPCPGIRASGGSSAPISTGSAACRSALCGRQLLEQLCRYITRPALANERVQTNAAGQVVIKLETAGRDGTTRRVMSPLRFRQRLAALVPRPRLHRIRLVFA